MPALAYVNGRYGPLNEAAVSVDDRGLQFGDAVYEVMAFLNGRLLDEDKHYWRLHRNLSALMIEGTPGDRILRQVAARLILRSHLREGLLYIQVSRGVARRDHGFPANVRPTLVMTVRSFNFAQRIAQQGQGVKAVTRPDFRWGRCDIKTTCLLPAVLAKQEARKAGAFEAVFVGEDGQITEGGSTNIWMVDGEGQLVTHPLSNRILPGVARDTLIALARKDGMTVVERPFSHQEAVSANELFMTSTTVPILPIVQLDDVRIGTGRTGPVVERLARLSWTEIERQTGWKPREAA